MVRTYASFVWNVPISEDAQQPCAELEVERLAAALRSAGPDVSPPEDAEYCWWFECRLAHLVMSCRIGLVGGDPPRWLLACDPRRKFFDRLRGRRWEDEQEHFVAAVDGVLRADERIRDVGWFTREEWNRNGDGT